MSKIDSKLTAERLRELVSYNPDTGIFTRRLDARRWKAGGETGSVNKILGYVHITVGGYAGTAHRLAWLYMTGEWPTASIDHKDGNRSNNRFSNLRDVSQELNLQNRQRAQADNKAGLLGVSMRRGRYRATLKVRGRSIYLGDYETPEEAHAAYLEGKRAMHPGNTL